MNLPDQEPEAVLERFKKWLNKGQDKSLLVPAQHEDFPKAGSQKGVTPAFYTASLYSVFFNELKRQDISFKEVYDDCFIHYSEEYPSAGLIVDIPFEISYEKDKELETLFDKFIKLLTEKDMIEEWERPEIMDYESFRWSLWRLFNAEMVRSGETLNLAQGNKFYRERYK